MAKRISSRARLAKAAKRTMKRKNTPRSGRLEKAKPLKRGRKHA